MNWHIVWDRSPALPSGWQVVLVALLLAGFFAWLARQRKRRLSALEPSLAALDELARQKRIKESLGLYNLIEKPLTVALIPLVVAIVVFASTFPRWLSVRESLNTNGAQVIEGPVQSAKRWIATGSGRTSSTVKFELQVEGKTFAWQGESHAWHDNLVHNNTGVLQRGKRVRVTYARVPGRDELLRIEAENTCELYLKCSGFNFFGMRWETKRD